MKLYFVSKLADINYRLAVHPDNARRRLASEAGAILALPSLAVPANLRRDFDKLTDLLSPETPVVDPRAPPRRKLARVQNRTAARYIAVLIRIEYELQESMDREE